MVLNKDSEPLVDVSDIMQVQVGVNRVFSGKQNTVTGLASPTVTELQLVNLVYDASTVVGGSGLRFNLSGLMTTVTTDSINKSAGTYKESVISKMPNATGEGSYQGTPFVISGQVTASSKRSAPLP